MSFPEVTSHSCLNVVQGPKKWLAKCDKHYPSRSGQSSLATAVANFTKPRTRHFFDLCIYMIQLMAQRRVLFFDATINKRSDIDFFLQIEFQSVPVKRRRRPDAGRAAERAQPPATEQPRQLARLPLHRQRLPSHTQAPSEALQQVLKIRFVIITK